MTRNAIKSNDKEADVYVCWVSVTDKAVCCACHSSGARLQIIASQTEIAFLSLLGFFIPLCVCCVVDTGLSTSYSAQLSLFRI